MVLENLNSHMQMNIPQTINLHYIQKSTHSWLKTNIRPETIQLKENTGSKIFDIGVNSFFFNLTPKVKRKKQK